MCITVITADLGPGHGALSVRHHILALSPVLTSAQRVIMARRLLAQAGHVQPADPAQVTCACGRPLNVSGREDGRHLRLAGLTAGAN